MSTTRDIRIWLSRIRECRNPMLWASAYKYERQRRDLLVRGTRHGYTGLADHMREVEDDAVFVGELRERLAKWTPYKPRAIDFMMTGQSGSVFFNEVTLYAIVRTLRPERVVETGGTPGKSTAFMLRAMERNGVGHLYTIDLPPESVEHAALARRESYHELRPAETGSNWIVPDKLRGRHTLILGKSSEHLPALLEKIKRVDIFFHDSDHSYQNMNWEFATAWPSIQAGGLLMSDDVLGNTSFFDFCRTKNVEACNVFNLGLARK